MLTLEQFIMTKNHQDFFQKLLPLATTFAEKNNLSNPAILDMVRKLAKRERRYGNDFDTDAAKEFLKLRAEYVQQLGKEPSQKTLELLFDGSLSHLEEQAEKFIWMVV
ncbi:hypothetical protein KW430_07465 [Vibrio fluvialis]|nr:hypothetical protein [Vibrio fluvialis]MBY7917739.1 hypothetical protein [Vibrio fluvialis]